MKTKHIRINKMIPDPSGKTASVPFAGSVPVMIKNPQVDDLMSSDKVVRLEYHNGKYTFEVPENFSP